MKTYCRLLLAATLLGRATASLGQDQPASPAAAPAARPVEIVYFDANRHKLPTEAGAVERRETTYRDTVSGTVKTFYLPSGKLKSFAPYAHIRRGLRHGTFSQYYESGQLRYQATFQGGKIVGDLVTYYPDGTLKRRDKFAPGQPATGECFGPDGQPVPYYSYEQMPVYPEGAGDQAAVARAVQLNTRYPAAALRQHVFGSVKVKFVVDKNGHVQHVEPIKPAENAVPATLTAAYAALQQAAAEAVRQLKPFTPGRQDGEPVAVSFTVPVTFRIQ
ncbi:energy transducer TonB [Hymenobacter ruricola]|uniref:TonB family protein n=1 Tax=Hymenobacter ruricola TaxID=2791023 RepID=A0ABS0I0A6_9BACT|nr:energy transducer TonB [Hymenobacter ruricola]MBF9220389.1 TonB family protein [Hymenobacter ruricola]